jgi:multidrug efflux pump subunit AcrB
VFLPVAFMSGIVGRFLESFGLTMAFSILVSMVVSFTLTPMLSARWLKAHRPIAADGVAKKPILERVVDRFYGPIERLYVRVLAWIMQRRWLMVAASALTLAASVPLLVKVPKGFLPKSDEARFAINVRAPEGTSLEATALVAERIARDVRRMHDVTSTLITIGDGNDRTPNLAYIQVALTDPGAREATQEELMGRVRQNIVPLQSKDLKIDVSEVPLFSGGGKMVPIAYEISGPDLAALDRYSQALVERVRKIPGAADVDTSFVSGKPELGLSIDRERAADLGVRVADVAETLRLFVGGDEVTKYREHGESYPVHVRGQAADRADLDGLSLVMVPSSKLGSVPLVDLVRAEPAAGPASITRLDRRRQVMLTANLAPGAAQSEVMAGVDRAITGLHMPAEYRAIPVGNSREMQRTGEAFLAAFGLSLLFMYLVLAAQFESWLHPVTILLALPLTLPFALVSLLVFRQQLDIYSMLGLLVLFGVVKKNAILQIDHTNHLRAQGLDRATAILEANRNRLRPILMTTFAFVAGMLPLLLSTGIGAGFNRATAGVIVGGQVLSLLLTLFATPVAYSLFDDLASLIRRKMPGKVARAERERELAELDAAAVVEAA